ncbi:MAG: lysylphosphatidylglycerol synthase transmembrane domain-containing protein [Candidatus Micrarchaeia archaeon]
MSKLKSKNSALNLNRMDRIKGRIDYKKRIKKIEYVLITILFASLVVFAAISLGAILNEGLGKFVNELESINFFYYSLALVTIFIGYLLRFPKWELYMKRLGVHLPRAKNLWIYFSMYSMDITPGRWGRAVVSYTINKLTKIKFSRTFPAVVTDIFTDFLGFAIICLFFAFFVHKYIAVSIIITALLLLPFIFLYNKAPFAFLKSKLIRFKRLKSFFNVGELYFKSNKLLGKDVYGYSLLFTVPSMFLNGLSLYFVILSFGFHLGITYIPTVIFIFSSSLIFGMITGIPGTLGVTDVAMLGALVTFFGGIGMNFGLASVITIFFRIVSVWFVELFGFTALMHTFRYWK